MPELPEVETISNQLSRKLAGSLINKVTIFDKKLPDPPFNLKGFHISSVSRFGKKILFHFKKDSSKSNVSYYLLIHLRMSGRLFVRDAVQDLLPPDNTKNIKEGVSEMERFLKHKVIRIKKDSYQKYVRATLKLNDQELYFFDVRRFGTLEWLNSYPLKMEGSVDPLTDDFSLSVFQSLLNSCSRQNIKSFLLRQDKVIGIGNIYASEILFKAGILPFRLCNSLNKDEIVLIHKAIISILKKAIKHQGTTFSDYQNEDGTTGKFQNYLKVYARGGMSCYKCKTEIVKVNQNQRSTFYCPECQV